MRSETLFNSYQRRRTHRGPAFHPLSSRIINAAWGSPLRDLWGRLPVDAVGTRPDHDGRNGCIGNGSFNTTPQYFQGKSLVVTNGRVSLFALISLDTTSERGIVVGVGSGTNTDSGFTIGVGATAPNAVGNNVTGVRGGINFTQSGAAIGVGLHSIAMTNDGTTVRWYVDGAERATGGTGATYNISGNSRLIMMNHGASTTTGPSAGVHVYFGAAWAKILPKEQIMMLHRDPWCWIA